MNIGELRDHVARTLDLPVTVHGASELFVQLAGAGDFDEMVDRVDETVTATGASVFAMHQNPRLSCVSFMLAESAWPDGSPRGGMP